MVAPTWVFNEVVRESNSLMYGLDPCSSGAGIFGLDTINRVCVLIFPSDECCKNMNDITIKVAPPS